MLDLISQVNDEFSLRRYPSITESSDDYKALFNGSYITYADEDISYQTILDGKPIREIDYESIISSLKKLSNYDKQPGAASLEDQKKILGTDFKILDKKTEDNNIAYIQKQIDYLQKCRLNSTNNNGCNVLCMGGCNSYCYEMCTNDCNRECSEECRYGCGGDCVHECRWDCSGFCAGTCGGICSDTCRTTCHNSTAYHEKGEVEPWHWSSAL